MSRRSVTAVRGTDTEVFAEGIPKVLVQPCRKERFRNGAPHVAGKRLEHWRKGCVDQYRRVHVLVGTPPLRVIRRSNAGIGRLHCLRQADQQPCWFGSSALAVQVLETTDQVKPIYGK